MKGDAVRIHLKPVARINSKPRTVVLLEGPTPELGDTVCIDGFEHVVTEIEPTWAWMVIASGGQVGLLKPGTPNAIPPDAQFETTGSYRTEGTPGTPNASDGAEPSAPEATKK